MRGHDRKIQFCRQIQELARIDPSVDLQIRHPPPTAFSLSLSPSLMAISIPKVRFPAGTAVAVGHVVDIHVDGLL